MRVLGACPPVVRRRSTLGDAGYEDPCAGSDCCCFSGESGDGVEAFVGGCGRRGCTNRFAIYNLTFDGFTNTTTL